MFSSGLTASALIAQVKSEADISPDIPDACYYQWLNAVEQLLYTEIIREQKSVVLDTDIDSPISIGDITPAETESQAIFEDIYKVYADVTELLRVSLAGGLSHPYIGRYWKEGGGIGYGIGAAWDPVSFVRVIYHVRPKIKSAAADGIVAVPAEFLGLVTAKLRGEAYKIANEDGLASKWLGDYNNELENFKLWVSSRDKQYGQ